MTIYGMWFVFEQSNSGGSFDEELSKSVFIQSESRADALDKAIALGIYLDGVEQGRDCPCCGDRWCFLHESHNSIHDALVKVFLPCGTSETHRGSMHKKIATIYCANGVTYTIDRKKDK